MSVRFENVSFSYDPQAVVLRDLSLEIPDGEFLLVVGHNGAGKSTLLKLMNGIVKPSAGRVTVCSRDTARTPVAHLAKDICVTFQNPGDQIFASTVLEEAAFGPRSLGRDDPQRLARLALELCGLAGASEHHPYDLAQPHRKLLTVASAIATGARILAFDEPSVSLSQPERTTLARALAHIRSEGRSLVIVSHDLGLFLPFADRLLILRTGSAPRVIAGNEARSHERTLANAGVRWPYAQRLERFLSGSATTDIPTLL